MKVLNAVPLTTTASRKATAFSLIMRMVLVPCFVVVGSPGNPRGGERGLPGPEQHIFRCTQFSITVSIENNSSAQSKKAMIGGIAAGCGSRRGRLFRGGRLAAASLSLRAWRKRRAMTVHDDLARGGRARRSCRPAGGQWGRIRPRLPGNASLRTEGGVGEEAPRCIAWAASGVRKRTIQMRKHQFELRQMQQLIMRRTQSGRRIAPAAASITRACAQLAATVPLLRPCMATTRSTSASAAVRASATHLASTAGRP